jgi:hypothetical protein
MRQKVEVLTIYETLTTSGDGLALLKAIKELVCNFQSQKHLPHALHESKHCFYHCVQGRHTTMATYMEQFQNIINIIEESGGSIGDDPGILEALTDATGTNDLAKLEKEAHEQYLAVAFLLGANSGRYGKLLLEDLENDFLQGQDRYPKTVTTAFSLLTNWK